MEIIFIWYLNCFPFIFHHCCCYLLYSKLSSSNNPKFGAVLLFHIYYSIQPHTSFIGGTECYCWSSLRVNYKSQWEVRVDFLHLIILDVLFPGLASDIMNQFHLKCILNTTVFLHSIDCLYLHPEIMEQKLAAQHVEMQIKLATENQRFAATHGTLRQDLAAIQHELQMLHNHIGSVKSEREQQIQHELQFYGRIFIPKCTEHDSLCPTSCRFCCLFTSLHFFLFSPWRLVGLVLLHLIVLLVLAN